MTLYEYLLDSYGFNNPIMTADIKYEGYSRAWLYGELKRLCERGMIIRYEKGVYYIPKKTRLGISTIDPRSVAEKKYIKSNGRVFGYYGGLAFLNQLGLSTQTPNVIEIYTNNEASKVRDVQVGSLNVRLRRTRICVTEKNAAALSFLELMNYLPAKYVDEEKRKIIADYIADNNITRSKISEFAPKFPDTAMRNLIESEVIYSVAR